MELRVEFYAVLLFGKSADVGFDFYRTDFQNQAVVDATKSATGFVYNLKRNMRIVCSRI
jgi:hypothetical protein